MTIIKRQINWVEDKGDNSWSCGGSDVKIINSDEGLYTLIVQGRPVAETYTLEAAMDQAEIYMSTIRQASKLAKAGKPAKK